MLDTLHVGVEIIVSVEQEYFSILFTPAFLATPLFVARLPSFSYYPVLWVSSTIDIFKLPTRPKSNTTIWQREEVGLSGVGTRTKLSLIEMINGSPRILY